jgi:mono/diheme cytochrome c family protein
VVSVLAVVLTALSMVMGLQPHTTKPAIVHAQSITCPATVLPSSLSSTMPLDFTTVSQIGADCMAWQEFIALNWKADPKHPGNPDPTASSGTFGTPGDAAPKVWESYLNSSTIFTSATLRQAVAAAPKIKQLSALSELGNADLSGIGQAGDGKWLTSLSHNLTYYEVRLNNDEAAYIQKNLLTTYAGQSACASQPGGFNLPSGAGTPFSPNQDTNCRNNPGSYGDNVGAIEVKAAWMPLPADHSLDYRYLTATARITPPIGQPYTTTVGLVGLHIIHKVPNAQQFVWATFEQIDNTPDENNGGYTNPVLPPNPHVTKPRPGYAYFNPACTTSSDPYYQCQHNLLPGNPCSSTGPKDCVPYSAPMQITRINPVGTLENGVTGQVWAMVPANSVFNYYRLINAQWPNSNTKIHPGSTTPLTNGDIQPPTAVANTTLETYRQQDNCLTCHQFAPIAKPAGRTNLLVAGHMRTKVLIGASQSPLAADYSFVFAVNTAR